MNKEIISVADLIGQDLKKSDKIKILSAEAKKYGVGVAVLDFSGVKTMTRCFAQAVLREFSIDMIDCSKASVDIRFLFKTLGLP